MDNKMTEHVHEFFLVFSGPLGFHCNHEGCTFILPYDEAMNRLNATENLLSHLCSCDEAFTGRDMHSTACPWYHLEWAFGKSKEDILESEDD